MRELSRGVLNINIYMKGKDPKNGCAASSPSRKGSDGRYRQTNKYSSVRGGTNRGAHLEAFDSFSKRFLDTTLWGLWVASLGASN